MAADILKRMNKFFGAFLSLLLTLGLSGVVPAFADDSAPSPDPVATPIAVIAPAPQESIDTSASPAPAIKPSKVISLEVRVNSVSALVLGWQMPTQTGSETISDFRITYKFDDFGTWLTWKHLPSTATEATISDLPLGVGITFAIRPVTETMVGVPEKVHLVTPSPIAPAALAAPAKAQFDFVAATWNAHSAKPFGYLPGRDCANWASQSLLKRGFTQTAKWHGYRSRNHGATMNWISSTKLRAYLLSAGKATVLSDAQRAQVQIGDIVQFDWWNKGSQEHTGIVTHIEKAATGLKIYYASHTAHGLWWSVDRSIRISHPGATVSYLHLP
ncbi:MAG: hypothetical protein RLZ69_379 [Actinomycetota bacterium]